MEYYSTRREDQGLHYVFREHDIIYRFKHHPAIRIEVLMMLMMLMVLMLIVGHDEDGDESLT